MKNKKIMQIKNNRLLKVLLIKSQKKETRNTIFKEIKYLKIALKIIFKYHIHQKKILFVGISADKIKPLTSSNSHLYLKNGIWLNGNLRSASNIITSLTKTKTKQKIINKNSLFKFIQKPDLIVTTGKENINEFYKSKIPVILLNSYFYNDNLKASYGVPNHFNPESGDDTFSQFLSSILEKQVKQSPSLTRLVSTKQRSIEYKNKKLLLKKKRKNIKKRHKQNLSKNNKIYSCLGARLW